MRTFVLAVAGVLVITGAVFAQGPAIRVIEPAGTNVALGPRTLNPSIVACTDVPTTTMPGTALRVLSSQSGDDHVTYAPGEIIVINGGTPQGLMAGQRYFTRRVQTGYEGEKPTPATPGAIRTTGWLTIVAVDERFALARIDHGCDDVAPDDYLEPFAEAALPATVATDGPPNFADMGRVMFGIDKRQTFGPGDLTNIDRGKAQGIGIGTRVAFYRDRQNGAPLVEMGAGVVVEVAENTAKVVLTRARDAVWRGDYVVVRGTAIPPR